MKDRQSYDNSHIKSQDQIQDKVPEGLQYRYRHILQADEGAM